MTGRFVAYYRVSTARQGQSGLGLEAQRRTVAEFVANRGDVGAEFVEVESGRKADRPQLAAALSMARAMKATLVVAKLDRLARDVGLFQRVRGSGVDIQFCDLPELPAGPLGDFIVGLLAHVAQLEAGLISKRTVEALASVKAQISQNGRYTARSGRIITRLGAPASAVKASEEGRRKAIEVRQSAAAKWAADVLPLVQDIQARGIVSAAGVAAELNRLRVPARKGGQWQAVQVQRLLSAAGAAP